MTEPHAFEWTDRDTLLYALGVGCGIADLAFTTENSHDIPQQVLPTYAVIACPAFARSPRSATSTSAMLLHGRQQITLHAPLPPAGKLSVASEVADIQDKGEGKNAIVMLRARAPTRDLGTRRRDADHARHPRRGRVRRVPGSAPSRRRSRTASPIRPPRCRPARTSR